MLVRFGPSYRDYPLHLVWLIPHWRKISFWFRKNKRSTVSFVAGQPLGYYSSCICAYPPSFGVVLRRAGRGRCSLIMRCWVTMWSLLTSMSPGSMKTTFTRLLKGVTISYQKSQLSSTGAASFAKRFRVRNMRKDLSPPEFARISSPDPIRSSGFLAVVLRQLSRHSRSKHYERVHQMRRKKEMPFELWLGRGRPQHPYLRGELISVLLHLGRRTIYPDSLFSNEKQNHMRRFPSNK